MNDNSAPCRSIRGVLLRPHRDGTVTRQCGVIALRDGRITAVEDDATATGPLLLPGLVDLHIHWPQGHVRGAFTGQLLPWLRESIWPAEAAFSDPRKAQRHGATFMRELHAAGTCSALLFGPPFLDATVALLAATAQPDIIDGPAIMEINAIESLQSSATTVLAAISALPIELRDRVAISPRFAPNMTAAGLAACAATALEHNLLVQSHVSENQAEIAWVRELFPEAIDYLDVYDRAGLLGPRTILAHGIHLSDRELARCAATGTVIAHCPSSNQALMSGRMPLERLRQHGVNWVLATDVGAGPKLSQLDAIKSFMEVHTNAGVTVTASEALARASVIAGAFLSARDERLVGLGGLEPGAPAHVVALDMPTGCSAKDSAEALLRAVLSNRSADFESLPRRVIRWGMDVAIGRHTI